jgi:hypothetical protein
MFLAFFELVANVKGGFSLLMRGVGRSFAKVHTHKRQIFSKNTLTRFPPSAICHSHDSDSDSSSSPNIPHPLWRARDQDGGFRPAETDGMP